MGPKYQFKKLNYRLIAYALVLSGIGVLLIRSATIDNIDFANYFKRQIVGVGLGLFAMVIVALIDYHFMMKCWPVMYVLDLVLLIATRLKGVVKGGARRWLQFPVIGRFQPSELTKLILILCLAWLLGRREEKINSPLTWGMILLMIGPHMLLVVMQPDLSTTLLITAICVSMIYVARLSYKVIGAILAVVIPAGGLYLYHLTRLTEPGNYMEKRLLAFVNPQKFQDTIYQQQNSVMAIGSGGLLGKGLNTTTFESVKNGNYLSEAHTDFIFTIAGEELGFIGCFVLLFVMLLLVLEILFMARRAKDLSGRLICVGVAALFAVQTFFNVAVATWIMPNTGIPLPFVSYGLSSVIVTFVALGMTLNVGLQRPVIQKKDKVFLDLEQARRQSDRNKALYRETIS